MLDMLMSRARFHQFVWTNPRAVILAKLGMRESAFLDLCQESGIPAPPGPVSVKVGSSNQHYRTRLPKRDLGANSYVFFAGQFTLEEQQAYFQDMLSEPLEDIESMTARFRKRLARINEHDDPFRLHSAIEGLIQPVPMAVNDDAAVDARRAEQRWLNLLNEIFLYAEALGGHCRFGGYAGRHHMIKLGQMSVCFTLVATDHRDRLRLDIVSQSDLTGLTLRWEDTGLITLENILPDIMVGMGVAAETILRRERETWLIWSPLSAESSAFRLRSAL